MTSPLLLISLTGADDQVSPDALARISARYPKVEWAILYFPEKEGTPRNPSRQWREDFLASRLPNTAAHLCGKEVFRDLLDPKKLDQRVADLSRYGRIQLNINARDQEFSDDEVLSIYRTLHQAGLRLILQHHAASESVINQFIGELDVSARKEVDILFDASKGAGQLPERWPVPEDVHLFCGYAGGLGPDVLEAELPRIEASVAKSTGGSEFPFWIDMESGLRTDNQFDLDKAISVLEICQRRDVERTSRSFLIQVTHQDIPDGLQLQVITWEQIKNLVQLAMDEGARRNVVEQAVLAGGVNQAPTSAAVGAFIDSVAGQKRTPATVAGRLTEEVVELALAAGLTAGKIMGHVADALHNQSLKASEASLKTVFPSQLSGDGDLPEECADVSLVLKDLCHVAHINLPQEEASKWSRFTQKKFRVGPGGTIYAIKPHIK